MVKNVFCSRKIFSGILLIIIILILIFLSNPVLGDSPRDGLKDAARVVGFSVEDSLETSLGKVLKKVLGVMGIVLLVLFVMGGMMWITSGGNSDKIKKAQGLLLNAIIGLIIVLSSYALVHFIIKASQDIT